MVQASEPTTDALVLPTDELSAPTDPAALTGDAAAGTGEGAASTTPQFDFDSDEGITAALASLPKLSERFRKQQDDGFQNGRQNRDRELRLERGSEETAKAWQEHLASRYGIELDEADRQQAPLWVKANRDRERTDYWRSNTDAVLDAFDVNERSRIAAALEQFEGRPEETEAVARQVYDTAVSRQVDRRVADLTIDTVPKDSKLWTSVQEYARTEAEKEFKAQAQERETPPAPPRTPVGAVGHTRTRADYANLSPTEVADLPEAEYRVAMGYGAAT